MCFYPSYLTISENVKEDVEILFNQYIFSQLWYVYIQIISLPVKFSWAPYHFQSLSLAIMDGLNIIAESSVSDL